MPIKIKGNKEFQRSLLSITKNIDKRFSKSIRDPLEDIILKEISQGVSPVAGKGKFKAYSKSYKDQISGKVSFRTIEGKVIPFNNQLKSDKSKFSGKKKSPVNLKLSGDMLKSLSIKKAFRGAGMIIKFTSPIAVFHNKDGAGKSKVKRRMLPTESGEKFNRKITKLINGVLEKAVKKSVKNL